MKSIYRSIDEELKPYEICLGNFIESMGAIEMVTGIVKTDDNNFQVGHTGWNRGNGFPDDILYSTLPIPLTEHWKICFGIEKDDLPEWIKYVHQVQNYYVLAYGKNLMATMDWDLLPKNA